MKRFRIKVGIIGVTFAALGMIPTATAVLPQQTVLAAETDYRIVRNINIYIKQTDGSKKLHGTVPQEMDVPASVNKNTKFTFPSVNSNDILGKGFEAYKPDKSVIPAAEGSYNSPPEDAELILSIDPDKALVKDNEIVRTIKYYVKGSDGKESLFKTEKYSIIFPAGSLLTSTASFPDRTVEQKPGYTADKDVVKGKSVKANATSFEEKVVYSLNSDVITETKTVWRKINFIDQDTNKQIRGSQSKGVIFSRDIIKNSDGKIVVVRDWQTSGTIPEYTVPDIEGYSHSQKTVPSKSVNVKTKDYEVNVYYTSTRFTVNYHIDENSSASSKKTVVDYGTLTKTLTISQLGFEKNNYSFKGWKAYREIDDSWLLKDASGKMKWMKLNNNTLPEGYTFYIYRDGQRVKEMAKRGNTHFYGQWEENKFTVNYHLDEKSGASSKKTEVIYGDLTKTLTTSELGFKKSGKTFSGWKAYREMDDSWLLQDKNGKTKWLKLVKNALPDGYSFYIYRNGQRVRHLAKSGDVHFYGTWK